MIQAVLFRKVDNSIHRKVRTKGMACGLTVYMSYNSAMKDFSAKMKDSHLLPFYSYEPLVKYKDTRVEKVDKEIYKNFKITCIQKDISISQGINLALVSWLESQNNDHSSMGVRT